MKNILFITDLCSGSRVPILRGVKERAAQDDMHVQTIELARVKMPTGKALSFWNPIGYIIEGSSHILPTKRQTRDLPIVHLDPNAKIQQHNPPFTVMNDNAGIAELALKALLKAGCEHFAFVGWTRDVNWSTLRLDAFKKTILSLGKDCTELLDPWTMGDASNFSVRLQTWLSKLPQPCGIFAANDDIATVLLNACRSVGLQVPKDIAVIGVDDEPSSCETTTPSLSSVRPDFYHGGYLAADLLIRKIEDPSLAEKHLCFHPAGVTLRQSTRRSTCHAPKVEAALELIRKQATSGLKAADVVKAMGLSERLAEARFKAATGRRITEEITEVRLAKVLELLRTPKQGITPIANLCGWESDVYLKRIFKSRFGMTMREWRAANLNK